MPHGRSAGWPIGGVKALSSPADQRPVHIQTHFVLSWLTGCRLVAWRDRVLVAWAGLAPDLDGLTALAGIEAYGRWHHTLTHGLFAALFASVAVAAMARQRARALAFAFGAFHLHLLCDFLGSGREWPIVYFYPLSDREFWSPVGWPLASWQNVAITAAALMLCGLTARRLGRTFVEACLPVRVDAAIVEVIRRRFGAPLPALEVQRSTSSTSSRAQGTSR